MQVQSTRCAGLLWLGAQGFEGVDHHAGLVVRVDRLLRAFVIFEVFVIHDAVDAFDVGRLAQLERGELDLSRATTTEHVHVGDRRALEAFVNIGWDVGRKHVLRVLDQHSGHVERHVAVADHGDLARV